MMSGARRRQRGFTLIEVLVALVIAGVALAACVRALGIGVTGTRNLQERMLALQAAENLLAELNLAQVFPQPGKTNSPCPQGPLQLTCEQDIQSSNNNNFRQITIRVRQGDGPALAQLNGILTSLR